MSQQTKHDKESREDASDRKTGAPTFWQTLLSVGQASFGVQNRKNKERDFEKGSVKAFITAALIFTVVFVLTLVVAVNLVLG